MLRILCVEKFIEDICMYYNYKTNLISVQLLN